MTSCLNFIGYKKKRDERRQTSFQQFNQKLQSPRSVLFGCSLAEHLTSTGRRIPLLVEWTTSYIEKCCQHTTTTQKTDQKQVTTTTTSWHYGVSRNIYRIPGSKSDVDALKQIFERITLEQLEEPSSSRLDELEAFVGPIDDAANKVNAVASLLKQYMMQLPDAIIPHAVQSDFLTKIDVDSPTVSRVENALRLSNVPAEHIATLAHLANHLAWIAAQPNAMSVQALSTVWAPNIFHSTLPHELVQHINAASTIIQAYHQRHNSDDDDDDDITNDKAELSSDSLAENEQEETTSLFSDTRAQAFSRSSSSSSSSSSFLSLSPSSNQRQNEMLVVGNENSGCDNRSIRPRSLLSLQQLPSHRYSHQIYASCYRHCEPRHSHRKNDSVALITPSLTNTPSNKSFATTTTTGANTTSASSGNSSNNNDRRRKEPKLYYSKTFTAPATARPTRFLRVVIR